jgi:hypothetical protein
MTRRTEHASAVVIDADLTLWPSDRDYRLPGSGTRSMLFRFEADDSDNWAGWAMSRGGLDFAPRTVHAATIEFWEEAPPNLVYEGAAFAVWYGGDIGAGRVTAIRS